MMLLWKKHSIFIEDFGKDPKKQNLILECHNMLEDFMRIQGNSVFICTRRSLL